MLGVYFVFGFYYSEYEGLNTALLSSSLTPGMHFRSVYFSGNIGISYFYALFYQFLPGVQWISWLEYLWLFISSGVLSLALWQSMPDRFSTGVKTVVMISVYILVFADHHMHLIYTRVSYMVCGSALIGLVCFFGRSEAIKQNCFFFILLNLFFVVGTLIRNEAAIACVLLLLPFALFSLQNIKQTIILFLFPLLVVLGQSLFFAVDIRNASKEEFYKQVEPDIEEQYTARGNLKPLSAMSTHTDSVKYALSHEMAFSDPRVMTPEWLRSLILPEGLIFTDLHQWHRVYTELYDIMSRYWYLVLIVVLLGLGLYGQWDSSDRYRLYYWLLFELSFWGLTVAQTYVDKVNERSWLPYISLFIFCHIILFSKNVKRMTMRRIIPIITICSILLVVQIYHLNAESGRMKSDLASQQRQYNAIRKLAADRILVANSSAFNSLFMSSTPFQNFDFSSFRKVYITDSYIITFLPYYQSYLEKECGCDMYAYPSFWAYLKDHKNQVLVISTASRMKAIENYLRDIHHTDLSFVAIDSSGDNELKWNAWEISQ
jgi:hypothetical protein